MKIIALHKGGAQATETLTVRYYASLDELPAYRWKEARKWMLVEGGIGGDLPAIHNRFLRMGMFLAGDKIPYAGQERRHLHNAFYILLKGITPRWRAFACLIQSLNNESCCDLSEDGLDRALATLYDYGIGAGQLDQLLSAVMDQLNKEWLSIDPEEVRDSHDSSMHEELERRRRAVCRYILTGDADQLNVLEEVQELLYKTLRPAALNLASTHNDLINMDREFAQLCTWLKTEGINDPQNMPVWELQQHFQFFKERYSKTPRATNK